MFIFINKSKNFFWHIKIVFEFSFATWNVPEDVRRIINAMGKEQKHKFSRTKREWEEAERAREIEKRGKQEKCHETSLLAQSKKENYWFCLQFSMRRCCCRRMLLVLMPESCLQTQLLRHFKSDSLVRYRHKSRYERKLLGNSSLSYSTFVSSGGRSTFVVGIKCFKSRSLNADKNVSSLLLSLEASREVWAAFCKFHFIVEAADSLSEKLFFFNDCCF